MPPLRIITRNGGMASIVMALVSRAKSAVAGQVAVWIMGLMIFFDDYSNTLVVGNTARSLTDKLKISREKLAYIVDSTAAPVACIALVTTWIAQLARDHRLDPALLATRADVESLLKGEPECRLNRGWRQDLVGKPIAQLVGGDAAVAFDGDGNLVLEARSHQSLL
jgi:hypothetical protein